MHYQWQDSGLVLRCFVQPRASRDEIAGIHNECLKIRLTAAPVDGKANQQLQKFIAKQFGVARRQVTLLQGETSRHKTLRIEAPGKLPQAAWIGE